MRVHRRIAFLAAATAAAALTAGAFAGSAQAAGDAGTPHRPAHEPPLLAFNHAYAMVDRETADAVEHSEYLGQFADRQIRTGNNGSETWTGRYLRGKETYLEFFGPGDAPGAVVGDTGLAVSADLDGDLATASDNLRGLGVEPLEFTQVTDPGDGVPIPWFDVVYTSDESDTFFAWAMEYREEFLDDPRFAFPPPAHPGDVSRDRYNADRYLNHQLRDVVGIQIATTAADIDRTVPLWRAGGLAVRDLPGGGALAFDGLTAIHLHPVPADEAGLRHIALVLNEPVDTSRTERLGNSTLRVGPGRYALWSFDPSSGAQGTTSDDDVLSDDAAAPLVTGLGG